MSKQQAIQSVRGMHDLLPADSQAWSRLHQCFHALATSYGYVYARTPIVEKAQLFERGVGSMSDIVMGEMYSFTDQGDERLCLRPEGTASMVRMGLQHGLVHHQLRKFYYDGPMFRRERPQKGRYRQFHQVGVEVFGDSGYWVELELLLLSHAFLQSLGIGETSLQINTLGNRDELKAYRQALHQYFSAHESVLGKNDADRLRTNPLRILDSKDPAVADLIADAPTIDAHLGDASQTRFEALRTALDDFSIAHTVNPRLVRGLEYYSHTVFEWVSEAIEGAQNTLIAGGRYDELSEMIGGRQRVPACGFAAGVERLLALSAPITSALPRLSLLADGDNSCQELTILASQLRRRGDCEVFGDFSPRKLSTKIKDYSHPKTDILLVMGERELAQRSVLASFPSGLYSAKGEDRILLELTSLEAWLTDKFSSTAHADSGSSKPPQ